MMNKIYKKTISGMAKVIIAIFLIMTIALVVTSTSSFGATNYTTDKYNVDVKISEDNSYLVKETIQVDFSQSQHGIYRYIPITSEIKNNHLFKMQIDKVSVDGYNYESYNETNDSGIDNMVVKIGDANSTVSGKQTYVINYRVRIYEDKDIAGDFSYLNVIPQNWETAIKSSVITITFPKKIDWNDMKIYSGTYGSTKIANNLSYNINEDSNTIKITDKNLPQGKGITYKIDLPEGYWVNPLTNDWAIKPILFILILIPLLTILLWFFFGRDPEIVKTVEFYPPEGITPAEIGYIVDGKIDQEDMASMIMYFGEKKYLSITEYKSKKFMLTKLMDIPENEKTFAKTFFNGFFKESDNVKMEELSADFGDTYVVAREQLESQFLRKKGSRLFTIKSELSRIFGYLLMATPAITAILLSAIYAYQMEWAILAIPVLLILILGLVMFMTSYDKKYSMKKIKRSIMIIVGILLIVVATIISGITVASLTGKIVFGIALVASTVLTYVFVVLMKARSKKSAEWLGKILGLKDFIKAAELPKLKKLVEDDPAYFYNVMPYAYVLGLSDKWAKNFENIPMYSPSWYTGYNSNTMFNVILFSHLMNNFTRGMANNIVTSAMNQSSGGFGGGGFGGGGFSGGGFGGGGGGSW